MRISVDLAVEDDKTAASTRYKVWAVGAVMPLEVIYQEIKDQFLIALMQNKLVATQEPFIGMTEETKEWKEYAVQATVEPLSAA